MEADVARGLLSNMADLLRDDADLAANTIEGETNLHEVIARASERVAELETMQDGLEVMVAQLQSRYRRLQAQERLIRTAILEAMEIAGLRRLELEHATLSTKAVAPKLETTDESAIPSEWWRPGDPRLDKKGLLDALKGGATIPGVGLSEPASTLQITRS